MSSENINSFVTLHQAILSFINSVGDDGLHNYEKYMQFAIEGISEEIYAYLAPSLEVVYKEIPESKIVTLPPDMQYYTKIGILVNGKVWTLTLNNEIAPNRTFSDSDLCEIEPTASIASSGSEYGLIPFVPHYNGSQLIDTLYGIGGGYNRGYYRVDMKARSITLKGSIVGEELVIEYVSTGVKANGATTLSLLVMPALRAYLGWRRVENDIRIPANEKQRKLFIYESEMEKLAYKQFSFTADEYLDTVYRTYTQGIKR